MYLDSSAAVAILANESDRYNLAAKLKASDRPFTSVVTAVEAAFSLGRIIKDYEEAGELVMTLLNGGEVDVVNVTPEIYKDVLRACARYGKGTGHPARLNFGDCFSYAYAKRYDVPLLFKGNDFTQTDVSVA